MLESIITRLSKDVKESVSTINIEEARFLVRMYYTIQNYRIRSNNQANQLTKQEKPNATVEWFGQQNESLENALRNILNRWTDSQPMGIWAKSITGIGPVLSAGLLAHIDIAQAPTVGHIWRFAGLDPTSRWDKKQKRPWNADLKVTCYKIGESFVKVQSLESDVYGKFYVERKKIEQERNEQGVFAEQAAAALAVKRFGVDTTARKFYEEGKLPPAHIHARARRYAVKLFLSHWHEEAYRQHYGTEPPLPYPIQILGHAHKV